nr:membrane protein [Cryptomonas curvata]
MLVYSILNQFNFITKITFQKKVFKSEINLKQYLKVSKKRRLHNYSTILFSKVKNFQRSHDKRTIYFSFLIMIFSFLGSFETIYLTIHKLNGSFAICSSQNCTVILDSVFSNFIEIPVSVIGSFLYLLVFFLVFKKLNCYYSNKNLDKSFYFFMLSIQIFLSFFSTYFALILKIFLQTNCPWCAFSMLVSSLLLLLDTLSRNGNKIINLNYIAYLILVLGATTYSLFLLNILEILSF